MPVVERGREEVRAVPCSELCMWWLDALGVSGPASANTLAPKP